MGGNARRCCTLLYMLQGLKRGIGAGETEECDVIEAGLERLSWILDMRTPGICRINDVAAERKEW